MVDQSGPKRPTRGSATLDGIDQEPVGPAAQTGSPVQNAAPRSKRVAQLRHAQLAAQRRRRQFLIGGGVLAVIAAVAGIGVLVQQSRAGADAALGKGPLVVPSGAVGYGDAVGDGGAAIPYGASQAAKVTLTVYEDFRCPYCLRAEATFENTYKAYAQAGKIKVQYHLVDLLDRNLGGTGSIRAGNAGACAQDAGKFEAYHDLLYANQPEETNDAYGSNAALIGLAAQVPGLDTDTFRSCVARGTHGSWVRRNYDALNALLKGSVSTPYYAINGTQFKMTMQPAAYQQEAFKAALDSALATAG